MDSGNTAFVLGSAALVMLMTPGLAFFYAGMVRARSALNIMMMSMVTLGVVGLIWVLFGFSLSFGDSHAGLIGGVRLRRPASARDGGRERYSAGGLRHVRVDVRDHHRGAGVRGYRRPGAVLVLDGVHRAVDGGGLRPAGPLDLCLRRFLRGARRLAGEPGGCARLRWGHGGRGQLGDVRPGAGAHRGPAPGLATRADAPTQSAGHTARRRIAVVRLVRLQRGFSAR